MKMKKSLAIAFALAIAVSGTVWADAQHKETDRNISSTQYAEEEFSLDDAVNIYLYRNGEYIEISEEEAEKLLNEKRPSTAGRNVTTGLINYYDLSLRDYYTKPARETQWFGNEGEEVQKSEIKKDIEIKGYEQMPADRRVLNKSFGRKFELTGKLDNINIEFNISHNKMCSAYISRLKCRAEGRALCQGIGGGEYFRDEKFTATYPSDKEELIIFIVEKDL